MNTICEGVSLSWNKGIYNSRIKLYVKERMERYLKEPEHTLGVLARGTDYVNTHLANHPIHASKEMIGDKIDEMLMADSSLRHIYICLQRMHRITNIFLTDMVIKYHLQIRKDI